MKRLGPELKMPKFRKRGPGASGLKGPNVSVPPFAADVYYDLRERRLLPLVALVIVAILAVPFLLGDSEEAVPPPTAVQSAEEEVALEVAGDRTLTVVQAKPGLRDYRKRLRGRTPTDPFKQKYTSLPGSAQLQSTVETSPSPSAGGSSEISITERGGDITEVEVEETGGDGGSGTSPGGSGGSGGGDSGGKPAGRGSGEVDTDGREFFAFRPDVRFGIAGSEQLKRYPELPLTSLLPKKDPVLVFIGVTEDGKRAVFDVSPEVVLVKDEGQCIGGRQSCGLLFMRAGNAVTLLTETPGRTFRLAVDAIEFVKVDPNPPARSSSAGERRTPRLSDVVQKAP